MRNVKEKKERALGTPLFLKAERSNSPKSALLRKPYGPGQHGQKRKRRISEYAKQLREKQKIQISFGLTNKKMRKIFKEDTNEKILEILRQRLDYVVFLLGLAGSPRIARQMVSHGHIIVNDRKMTISSYHVRVGDVIGIRVESQRLKLFENTKEHLKKHECPSWLKIDASNLKGECIDKSTTEDIQFPFDLALVGQFYSR